MRLLLFLLISFFWTLAHGQASDRELIQKAISTETKKDQRSTHIEVHQFFDTCIYDEKCGVFLKHSFKKVGIIKGFFLSIDRRLRCSALTRSQALPVRFNKEGYIIDHAEDYSFKNN